MADLLPVIVPTHGRAGNVATIRWLTSATLCVAENQKKVYAKAYPDAELLVHPDSIKGIIHKRQWIYDTQGDCFMLDDDIVGMQSMLEGPGEKARMIGDDLARALIDRLYREAIDLDCYLFGFAPYSATFKPLSPFRLTGLVYGQAMGIRRSDKLSWNPAMTAAGDYWISCMNAFHHRMALQDWRFCMKQAAGKTFKAPGGTALHRTQSSEHHDNEILVTAFGEDVIVPKKGTKLAAKTHVDQRSVKIPF